METFINHKCGNRDCPVTKNILQDLGILKIKNSDYADVLCDRCSLNGYTIESGECDRYTRIFKNGKRVDKYDAYFDTD